MDRYIRTHVHVSLLAIIIIIICDLPYSWGYGKTFVKERSWPQTCRRWNWSIAAAAVAGSYGGGIAQSLGSFDTTGMRASTVGMCVYKEREKNLLGKIWVSTNIQDMWHFLILSTCLVEDRAKFLDYKCGSILYMNMWDDTPVMCPTCWYRKFPIFAQWKYMYS